MIEARKNRIDNVDLLKGLVMVIMALDHTRDYFHQAAFLYDPADPVKSDLLLFFTRWITHFCAPAFCFLAGMSAFFMSRNRSRGELSGFLLKRGIWLVLMELTVINFSWYFDFQFRTINLIVIWSLGWSMIALSGLIHFKRMAILVFSLILIGAHNLLDTVHFEHQLWWSLMHEFSIINMTDHLQIFLGYPLIPWVAVMSLGYCFGPIYETSFEPAKRKRLLNILGISSLLLFFVLRYFNSYGDPQPWTQYENLAQNLIGFFNPAKYPPSLMYLLMTLGAVFVFLANSENLKGKIVNFFSMFGRVPFFYYVLHLYLIHLLAMLFAQLTGFGWDAMLLSGWISFQENLKGYGFNLGVVYLIWIAVIALLYPVCKRFDSYRKAHKEKNWLSYL
ncbi:MAG: heparan-alpha-glucosaminide N-acetyltransferase domain-containing protein [Undibacterium sp.]|nr:heparan-alpha-glucosaminide N-acetyltransferase domain-containing protein [Undibacterium sp.]